MGAFFDATSNPTTAGTSDLSWTHALGNLGSSGLIIVIAETENSSDNISGATFNGVTMNNIVSDGNAAHNGSFVRMFELHGVNVPAAGNYTVTVTFSAFTGPTNSRAAGAMSFGGVKNQNAEATASIHADATSPLAQSIITVTKNALVVVGYGSMNVPGAIVNGTDETREFNAVPASGEQSECDGFYKIVATPASTNTSLTVNNPQDEAMVLASFEIAPASGGALLFF